MRLVPRGAPAWLGLVLLVHLAWGISRVPGKVWQRRLEEIDVHRQHGAAEYFLGAGSESRLTGAAAVQWLLARTPPTTVVLWRGETKGAFELASGLLAPRWLVHVDRVPATTREYGGRPLATGEDGTVILVGCGDSVVLEFR